MNNPFSLAIIHHHLHVGGVTRVIQNSVAALKGLEVKIVILTGEPPEPLFEKNANMNGAIIRVVDGLGYSEEDDNIDHSTLTQRMELAAKNALRKSPDLWHFHNHSLGKNPAVTETVYAFAQKGYRLLLHIHDFAEDGRVQNYSRLLSHIGHENPQLLESKLYPQASHVHYAVINGRDHKYLNAVNIDNQRLHLLPNAVHIQNQPKNLSFPERSKSPQKEERLFLYPTRAIRRKNMGEFLLWATLGKKGDRFASTLAPENPKEQLIYNNWVKLAKELNLPATFNIGKDKTISFEQHIASAYSIVTTSITEGFGLAFLEPWLMRRPVVGRNLAAITKEFQQKGIDLTSLYDRLYVPIEWIGGRDVFYDVLKKALHHYYQSYQRQPSTSVINEACEAAMHNQQIDFGRLNEDFQKKVICHLNRSPGDRCSLYPESLDKGAIQNDIIEKNYAIIIHEYSLSMYRKRLLNIYQKVLNSSSSPVTALDNNSLLDHFLNPFALSLLRM